MHYLFQSVAAILTTLAAIYFSPLNSRARFDEGGCCPVKNWEHRHEFSSSTVIRPKTLEDVVAAVNLAREQRKRVTVIGSGHSYADIAVPDNRVDGDADRSAAHSNGSLLICMRCFSGLVGVNDAKKQVTVLAGTSLEQLIEILDQHHLALDVIPTVFEPTIGGILAVGTHGCGTGHSSFASMVREIELVTPSGEVVAASPTENTDIFYGATINLGALGVLTKVTLQAGPSFNLFERAVVLQLDDALKNFERLMMESEYVKFLIEYHTGTVQVFSSNRTQAPPTPIPNRFLVDLNTYAVETLQLSTSFFPDFIPAAMRFLINQYGVFGESQRTGVWWKVLSIQERIPLHLESEFAVPFDKVPEAVETVSRIISEIGIGISVFNEVRCVSGDKFWLSNDYADRRCHVTLGLYNQDQRKAEYFGKVAERLIQIGAQPRPHWAKFYTLHETQFKTVYPKWDDFVALKRKLDPMSMFCNGYLRRIFTESKVCV